MKKAYETPELEVLLFDLREVAMLQRLASATVDTTGEPTNGKPFPANFDQFDIF